MPQLVCGAFNVVLHARLPTISVLRAQRCGDFEFVQDFDGVLSGPATQADAEAPSVRIRSTEMMQVRRIVKLSEVSKELPDRCLEL